MKISIAVEVVNTSYFIRNNALWGKATVKLLFGDGEATEHQFEGKLADFGQQDANGDVHLGQEQVVPDTEGQRCERKEFLLI